MRRRMLSLFLALCMVLGMLPVTSLAAETGQITVTAGETAYPASYVGTGGGESQGAEGDVYALQLPGVTELVIANASAEGSVTAANLSGSILVESSGYPVTLPEEEVSSFVLSEEELAECSDFGIDFTGADWACIVLTEENASRDYLFLMLGGENVATIEETAAVDPTVVYTGTDWPCSDYYVSTLTLDGVKVDYISGTDIYLNASTAADAAFTFTVAAGGSSAGNLGVNWNDDSTNAMTYTGNLTDGTTSVKIYAYKAAGAGASRSGTKTFNLYTAEPNNVPALADGVAATSEVTKTAGEAYTLDLNTIFTDEDGDALTYSVSVDGAAAVAADAAYSYTNSVAGIYTLIFTATDGKCMPSDYPSHTVILTQKNSETTYAVPVSVADTVDGLTFHADSLSGDVLTYENGSVQVPENVTTLWWGTSDGMSASCAVSEGISLNLQLTTFAVSTAAGTADSAATVVVTSPDGNTSAANGYTYLLASGSGYTYAITPGNSVWNTSTLTAQTVTTELSAEVEVVLTLKNAKTVTVPTGAEVHVYSQSGYSNGNGNDKEIPAVYSTVNAAAGTTTYYYGIGGSSYGMGYSYTAFYQNYISYAGYFNSVTDVVLTWDGETKTPSYRGVYDTTTTFGSRGEDSVVTNVNSNGHLVLNDEFMLRAYRSWQIIDSDTTNIMIEPEFNYTTSNGNVTITPYNKRTDSTTTASGTSSNNWVYLTPNGSGITYLEIGYDAVHIVDGYEAGSSGGAAGQPGNFTWNASDPNRTALIVVQTDGNAASGITFGIQSPSGGWDYEYDTFYFTESQGSLTMIPTGDVATVSVSHDKGNSYTTLSGVDGTYTVPIISGNNIIRITDSNGKTAFQVVRGKQISYTISNITEGKEADEAIYPGDTVRITFDGMHTVCPKISGIYNPGYPNANALNYVLDGATITQSTGYQYNFHNNVWLEVTVGTTDAILTGGYMNTPKAFGQSIGALYQASAVNSSATGATGRNILPDITIDVIEVEDKAPEIVGDATRSVSVKVGFSYTLDLKTVFKDLANDTITYYFDTGDGWKETAAEYSFAADTAGEYTVKFKAVDSGSKESEVFTLIITAEAVAGAWDGTTRMEVTPNASGVYAISTAAELAWFADQLNTTDANRSWNAVLTADIYLNNKTWPIIVNNGTSGSAYSGTFDGQGHTIYGLAVNSDSKSDGKYLGLFGYVSGTVQNLTVKGSVTASGDYSGGIAGQAAKGAKFVNCLTDVTVTGGDKYVGGMVGCDKGGSYDGCVNLGDISGAKYVGGITFIYSQATVISNCYNRGDVTGTGYVGGLAGVYLSYKPTITNCYSTGNVSGSSNTGKFAGARYSNNFSNCYSISEATLSGSGGQAGTEVSAATLKTYASTLGDAWTEDTTGINDGYPVLTWQNSSGTVTPTTYTVTLTEGEGYTITASEGSASPVTEGGSYSFTVTVNEGYEGTPVVKANETELTAVDGVYTIENITADQTVTVTGITVIPKTYTVTLTEGEGYTIAAIEGSTSPVTEGGSYSFTVTVSEGYEGTPVVMANETELTAVEGVYTIENITADQTVTITGVAKKEAIVYGDLNGDGEIRTADAVLVYAIANGKQELTEEQLALADVNGDGEIRTADAVLIYAYANGKITSFPVENK